MATQRELDHARQIGSQGGSVDTNGRHWTDKQAIDNAVNNGRNGR